MTLPSFLQPGTKTYDIICASPVIAWYSFSLYSQLQFVGDEFTNVEPSKMDMSWAMSICSHGAILLFATLLIYLLLRRHPPISGTGGFFPRFAALAGTYLSTAMITLPQMPALSLWVQVGTLLTLMGTAFAVYALISLGRSVSIMAEARALVTSGPYRIVRHPLYLGEQIALVGLMLQFFSYWAVALLAFQFTFQFYRMRYEERLLKHTFPEYKSYAARTYRLIPLIY